MKKNHAQRMKDRLAREGRLTIQATGPIADYAAKKMSSEIITVTPDLAAKWLEGNVANRSIRDSKVHQYSQDILEDRWLLTHQGVAFDTAGRLIDGQHRLWAIIEAGKPVQMMVTYGVDPDAKTYIDEGLNRTVTDLMRLKGDDRATNFRVAVARRMLIGTRTQVVLSPQEVIEFMEAHEKAIAFAVDEAFQGRRVLRATPAPVVSVIARAYYHEDRGRLMQFGEALLTGMPKGPGDAAVVLLRNWLMQGAPEYGVRVSKDLLIYMKTQRALVAFLKEEQMRTLYLMRDEQWPLPGEQRRSRK